MLWAKQSTAASLIVGPILDSAGAEYTSAVIGDLSLSKNGGTLTALAAAATLTHIANGQYTLALTTGNTDTLGRAQITCNKSTYQMPPCDLMIFPAMVYDSMVLGTDRFDVNVTHITDTAQTARDIGASVLLSNGTGTGQIVLNSGVVDSRLADAVSHGGTLGSSTATFALSRLSIVSQSANQPAVTWTGNGSGAGLLSTGGTTGHGIHARGGATSGSGVRVQVQGDDVGMAITGGSTGAGMSVIGGSTGIGMYISGGSTSGVGLSVVTTSGNGINVAANAGHALNLAANGTSKHGILATGGTAGTSDGISAVAGTGGVPIRGDITGNITGTITTATNVTTVNGLAANVITAAATAADYVTEIQTAITGGAYDLDTDANGRIRIVDGTGAGELNTSGGNVFADMVSISGDSIAADNLEAALDGTGGVTITAALTGNITGNLSGSVGSVTGNVGGNVTGSVGSIATGGISSASFAAGAINNAAMSIDGSELTAIPWNAAWDAEVQSECADALTAFGASTLTGAAAADAVWDEAIAGHLTAGSTGAALNAAGSAGDPWGTGLPGAYGVGTAGYIIGTNLNATVSSRASQTSLDTLDDYVDTEVAAIKAKTDQLTFTVANRVDSTTQSGVSTLDAAGVRSAVGLASANLDTQLAGLLADTDDIQTRLPAALVSGRMDVSVGAMAANVITAAATAADYVTEIQTAITGGAYDLDTDANGRIRIVDGTGAGEIDTNAGAIAHVILADTITTYTGNTPQTGDSFARIGATGSGLTSLAPAATALSTVQWTNTRAGYLDNLSGGAVALAATALSTAQWTNTRAGYLDNLSAGAVATAASIAALNNLSAAQVNAEVVDAIATDTYALPGQVTPSTTPTIAEMVRQLFQLATNPVDQTSTTQKIYNRAGDTVWQKRTVGETGGTVSLGALATGP